MADLNETIRTHLQDDILNKRLIDVVELAKKIHVELPDIDLLEISERVFEAIVEAGGNAHWGDK